MRRAVLGLMVLCALLLVLPALAQLQEEAGVVGRVTFWKIKAGMVEQFEEGLKAHNVFHAAQNDDWALHTWQIVTGKRAGQYVRGTFDHHWADFDAESEMAEADAADSAKNLDPYIESGHLEFFNYLPDLSRPPEDEGPAALVRVTYFHVRPGRQGQFLGAVGKAHEGIGKTNWPSWYFWYERVDGGKIPTFLVALPRDNWAGFTPQEKSFAEMLAEAFGEEEAHAIMRAFAESIESEWSETAAYRADLSLNRAERRGGYGALIVKSKPDKADIEVNGRAWSDPTDTEKWTSAGDKKVRLTREGCEPAEGEATVRAGQSTTFYRELVCQ